MSVNNVNLNLTRKWRSKNFDQIVGQDLSVRMLRNSLYLNQFFPVYLFSGQRGCGKTSTARVFASAVNCKKLSDFQKKPKKFHIPCLECSSCSAMISGTHPDFIEIDAASHTGVDNVRQIIESSSFLPIMGNRKIYLIDEAHMLSKAAFNAFLKILEEPPPSVLFILATTNPQKIIETVKSRCFQLFFGPVLHKPLLKHLKNVCEVENISYDDKGLGVIVKESQGSVRDMLNILEQVRFSAGSVTKKSVQKALGHIDDESLINLLETILIGGPRDILLLLKELRFEAFSAEYIWNKLVELLRVSIWLKHDVDPNWFLEYSDLMKTLMKKCSWTHLNNVIQMFYDNEILFLRTTAKHSLLEMILIQISKKNNTSNDSGASSVPDNVSSIIQIDDEDEEFEDEEEIEEIEEVKSFVGQKVGSSDKDNVNRWSSFLNLLSDLNDPLLSSIFKNGRFISFDSQTGQLQVEFLKRFSFFKDSLKDSEASWLPLLKRVFVEKAQFKPLFVEEGGAIVSREKSCKKVSRPDKNDVSNCKIVVSKVNNGQVDVSDVVAWKKANTLLKYFPGRISEIQEG